MARTRGLNLRRIATIAKGVEPRSASALTHARDARRRCATVKGCNNPRASTPALSGAHMYDREVPCTRASSAAVIRIGSACASKGFGGGDEAWLCSERRAARST